MRRIGEKEVSFWDHARELLSRLRVMVFAIVISSRASILNGKRIEKSRKSEYRLIMEHNYMNQWQDWS